MSLFLSSLRWRRCLLHVYSTPAWEISHKATTWIQMPGEWIPQPGPPLRLIYLALENNDCIISNLAPCVKYGKRFWLATLNSTPRLCCATNLLTLLQQNSLSFSLERDDFHILGMCVILSRLLIQGEDLFPGTLVATWRWKNNFGGDVINSCSMLDVCNVSVLCQAETGGWWEVITCQGCKHCAS